MKKMLLGVTIALGILAFAAYAETSDISVFSLKDGSIYRGGVALDCYVNEVPSEIDGPIRYWSVLGPDVSDAVLENETGVWFFAQDGACLTFVPLESEYGYQDIVFSPDGGKFVLATGSGMRPDVFFEVYGEGTEKLAELIGVIGQLAWVDPLRFVFTLIDEDMDDDIREGAFHGLAYDMYLSVAMYDTAAMEMTVLKKATGTQNFLFDEVIEDGNAVTVTEKSVKALEDWADDEKIEMREIRVEIPAAG